MVANFYNIFLQSCMVASHNIHYIILCMYMYIIPCNIVSNSIDDLMVTDLMVTASERSALLEASPPSVTNGIIISYIVYYNVIGSTNIMTMNFTTTNQHLRETVGSLLPFTTYIFSVRVCTSVGCGPSSNTVTAITLEGGELT